MPKVILSEEEFLAHFKKSDKLWYMESRWLVPSRIMGPVTISRLVMVGKKTKVYFKEPNHPPRYVSDLTGKWNGVFLSEEDAGVYFEDRKRAFETDPNLKSQSIMYRASFSQSTRDGTGSGS